MFNPDLDLDISACIHKYTILFEVAFNEPDSRMTAYGHASV